MSLHIGPYRSDVGTFGGIRLQINPYPDPVYAGQETMKFQAHPLIKWLARWLPIKPYVEASYPRYRDPDPVMMGNTVICTAAQARELKRLMDERNAQSPNRT